MSDDHDLQRRIELLEQRTHRPPPPPPPPPRPGLLGFLGRAFGVVALGGVLALLTVNVWLAVRLVDGLHQREREHLFWLICHEGSSPQQRSAAFMQLLAFGNDQWIGAHLDELQLAGTDLHGVRLEDAVMRACNLQKVNFNSAGLTRCSLSLGDLTEANFESAVLEEADLFKSNLVKANFRQANLKGANLEQVEATGANFVFCNLVGANLLMADFAQTNLSAADLTAANLEVADLSGSDLTLTNFRDARFRDTNLSNSNWWRARGLTAAQISEFEQKFAPADQAPEELKADFQKWLNEKQLRQSPRPGN